MDFCLLQSLGLSLVLTIILEESFAILFGIRNKKDILLICLVNIITNPIVVMLYHLLTYYNTFNAILVTLVLELFAVLVEWNYYKLYCKAILHPFIFSVLANLFSYGTGIILNLIL